MRIGKNTIVFALAAVALVLFVSRSPRETSAPQSVSRGSVEIVTARESSTPTKGEPPSSSRVEATLARSENSPSPAVTNKIDRHDSIRETFRALAKAGDPIAAIRAAKEIKDANEKETALLALVTEWTKGELRQPQWRARSISEVGLEAALGMELAAQPDLAMLWADELSEGAGRAAILQQVAKASVVTDPASAFRLSEQIPEEDREKFYDEVFQYWGRADTASALKWAENLPENERNAAINSIRQVAPVGIGAVLGTQGEYTVINDFVPGTPAQLSGQLQKGDRLLAIAQGDNTFDDARNLSLPDIVALIRGAPDTTVQLRVENTDAPAGSKPRTMSITRGQINFGGKAK